MIGACDVQMVAETGPVCCGGARVRVYCADTVRILEEGSRVFKKYVLETRPQFLALALVLVVHGSALAAWHGSIHLGRSVLAAIGLILLQASVNVLNDWHDWTKSGIDHETVRTPFSGGSGMLPAQDLEPREALMLGIGTLLAGSAIGLYLAWVAGWELLVIGLVGAVLVVLYTPVFTRTGLGEIMAGAGLGILPVVGTYFLITGGFDTAAWVSGIPATLLTYNLLLLNEFPDTSADTAGGRHHMVVVLGKRRARWLYAAVEVAAFVSIVVGVTTGVLTPWVLLALVAALPAAKATALAIREYDGFGELVPALGANVQALLGVNVLMAVGYVIAALLN
jgi:1,4-dihydroxy-2-naphthoate octaprenyltransferase